MKDELCRWCKTRGFEIKVGSVRCPECKRLREVAFTVPPLHWAGWLRFQKILKLPPPPEPSYNDIPAMYERLGIPIRR